MTSDYTIGDRLWDILFCVFFCFGFSIAMLIFGIPLLIIHLRERRKRKLIPRDFGE